MVKSFLQDLSIGGIILVSGIFVYPVTTIFSIALFIIYFVHKFWLKQKWSQYQHIHSITIDTFVDVESVPPYLQFTAHVHNVNIDRRRHNLDTI